MQSNSYAAKQVMDYFIVNNFMKLFPSSYSNELLSNDIAGKPVGSLVATKKNHKQVALSHINILHDFFSGPSCFSSNFK